MRKISISAFIIAVLLTGSLYLVNQRVNDLANKVASLIKVGASQSISSLTELTSLSHNDVLPITEVNGLTTKKVKWGTATSSMKAVFDPLYSPIFSTSAGLAGLLSDETGSSGGFVRAGSPTITSPVISSLSSLSVGSDATGDIYYRNGSGNFVRLAMPSGSGYYLTGSSTLSIPQWDNNILTNPYSGAMVFNATTTFNGALYGANRYVDYLASTTISGATTPVAVFIATSTNAVWATNASNATTSDFLGFVRQNVTNGATTSVQIDGVVGGFTGLTAGKEYYASTTGVLSTVYNNGTAEIYVGRAISSTQLLLDRKGEGWQYLGSATCSIGSQAANNPASVQCDTSSIPFARFAEVTVTNTNTTCASGPRAGTMNAQIRVYKNGANGLTNYVAYGCTQNGGSAIGLAGVLTITFTSTSSIRVIYSNSYVDTGSNGGGTATAYFYR